MPKKTTKKPARKAKARKAPVKKAKKNSTKKPAVKKKTTKRKKSAVNIHKRAIPVRAKKPAKKSYTSVLVVIVVILIVAVGLKFIQSNFSQEQDTQQETQQQTQLIDQELSLDDKEVIATVNGQPVEMMRFKKNLVKIPEQMRAMVPAEAFLNQSVLEVLMLNEAERRGIGVSQEELDLFMQQLYERTGLSEEEIVEKLAENNIDMDFLVQVYKDELITMKLLNETVLSKLEVTEEELLAVYNEQVSASHILVETEQEALDIVVLLDNGGDFAELAKEKSIGPSAERGGELGNFGKGQMVPEFENAVFSLEINEYTSTPVQTQYGFHVVKRTPLTTPFEEVKEHLEQTVLTGKQTEAMQQYSESLWESADIEILVDAEELLARLSN